MDDVQGTVSAIQGDVAGQARALTKAGSLITQGQESIQKFHEVNHLTVARLDQTDKNLLLNQEKIKVLTNIQIKQEENMLVNRKGLKELMGQLDEIENDIDTNIDKQYQLHH